MDTQRIGMDVGYGDTKAAVKVNGAVKTVSFPSVLGNAERQVKASVLGGRQSRVMRLGYKGVEYYVGDDAIHHSRTLGAGRQDRQRIGSDEERILMLAALAQLGIENASIVTGLPVLWFAEEYKTLKGSWRGEHRLFVNGKERIITVTSVRVIPQPFGGFYHHFLNDAGQATVGEDEIMRTYGFLDVGFNTTDISAIQRLQPEGKWSRGVQVGVRNVIGMVGEDILHDLGCQFDQHEVDRAIRAGHIEVYGQSHDISRWVESATEHLAGDVRKVATDAWGNGERLAKVLIFGGGAAVMGKALLKVFPRNGVLLPNPAMANAIGFCKIAQRQTVRA